MLVEEVSIHLLSVRLRRYLFVDGRLGILLDSFGLALVDFVVQSMSENLFHELHDLFDNHWSESPFYLLTQIQIDSL